jgi:predicted PurR-regulated permease PerM
MSETNQKNIPWAFLTFLILILLLNLVMFAPYLLAIYFGWIISTVLHPMQERLEHKGWKPPRAALLGTLVALFTMVIPIGGFGYATVKNLANLIGPYTQSGVNVDRVIERVYSVPLAHRFFDDQNEMRAFVDDNSKKVIGSVAETLRGILATMPEMALQIVLALLTAYFILVDGKKLRNWMSPRIPLPIQTKAEFAKRLNDTAYSSFLSMLAAAVAQSLVVFVGFLILGVPFAPLALGLAFICAWFPIFGVTPVWVAGVIYLFVSDSPAKAVILIVFGVIAGLADNVVRPWVLKGRSDIHPLVSLVAIFGGIAYLGIPGVLVGPVVVAWAIEFLRIWPTFAEEVGLLPRERAATVAAIQQESKKE